MSYYMMSGAQLALNGYRGFGALGAFGAVDFNAEAIWSDCLAGANKNNAAGKRCGQAVQAALNQLGYGPLQVDGAIGSGTMAALKKFSIDNGFGTANWPTKPMLIRMEELMKAGEKPGPAPAIASHKVGDEFVPGADPATGKSSLAAAGMSTGMMIGIGALALVAIGGLALIAKKKKSQSSSSSTASTRV